MKEENILKMNNKINIDDIRNKLKSVFLLVFNKILEFLLNWRKKHKILSFIICTWIVIKIICFPIYVYKYFRYGHFEKVAVKYSNDECSNLYETQNTIQYDYDTIIEKGTLLLYMTNINNPRTLITGVEKFTQKDDFLLHMQGNPSDRYQLFNKYTDLIVYSNSIDDYLYMYDKKRKKFIKLDTKNKKFDNVINKVKPSPFVKDYPDDDIYRLDNNNLLIIKYETIKKGTFQRLSINDNKFHEIDISEIKEYYSDFIQLKDNKFLFMRGGWGTSISAISLYELKDDKFKKIDIPLPKDYKKYNFSTENPLVLDENRVIFIGGHVGGYLLGHGTKKCYLYDIKKAEIIRINDFPTPVEKLNLLKTSDGENYIHFNYEVTDFFPSGKHSVYRYKK